MSHERRVVAAERGVTQAGTERADAVTLDASLDV
jgi:hypothetical protein